MNKTHLMCKILKVIGVAAPWVLVALTSGCRLVGYNSDSPSHSE